MNASNWVINGVTSIPLAAAPALTASITIVFLSAPAFPEASAEMIAAVAMSFKVSKISFLFLPLNKL